MSEDIVIQRAGHSARISLLGATVVSYQHEELGELLWVSPLATRQEGKAIRGGIPVCWPWFASDPRGPSHGLARTRMWSLVEQREHRARLGFEHPGDERFGAFGLELEVSLDAALQLRLTHYNRSTERQECTGALHSYFRARAFEAEVRGLGASPAFDKVEARELVTDEPIAIRGKIDMVVTSSGTATLVDGGREIVVHRDNAPDVVIWNPARDRPGDVPEGGEREFVCVEAAGVSSPWTVAPGQSATMTMRIDARSGSEGSRRS